MSQQNHQWRVLLIGGSSGVGKTAAAQALARRTQTSLLLVDDIRLAIQQVTTPHDHPALHFFLRDADVWSRPPEQLRDGLIRIGEALLPALATIIGHHVAVDGAGPLIIEGDGILPRLAVNQQDIDLRVTQAIQSVFLSEPEEHVILENMHRRGRGFRELDEATQRKIAKMSWLYGQWLCREAESYALPVIAARPYETLIERIDAVLDPIE